MNETENNKPTGGRGKPRGPRGRFVSPTLDRVAELVAAGAQRPPTCGLVEARRLGLIQEWAKLMATVEALDRFVGTRLLTGRLTVRVPYRRQLTFEKRIQQIESLLGWDEAKPAGKSGLPDRVLRRMTPAARESYERGE